MRRAIRLLFIICALLANGCAMRDSLRAGNGQVYLFDAPYDDVRYATIRAMIGLGFLVDINTDGPRRYYLGGWDDLDGDGMPDNIRVRVIIERLSDQTTKIEVLTRITSIFGIVYRRDWGPEIKARLDDELKRGMPVGNPALRRCIDSGMVKPPGRVPIKGPLYSNDCVVQP
jgi:hypothetical protein